MTIALNQVHMVRVATVMDAIDMSVGQIAESVSSATGEVVWIDWNGASILPQEFGNAVYVGEVSSVSTTRDGVTRAAIRPRAYVGGGTKADGFRIITSGSDAQNVAVPTASGADLTTMLDGVGTVTNQVWIRGWANQPVGWTGRLSPALSWNTSGSKGITKRFRVSSSPYDYDDDLDCGVWRSHCDLATFNTWLGANLPEVGAPIAVGGSFHFTETRTLYGDTLQDSYLAQYNIHMHLSTDRQTIRWYTVGQITKISTTKVAASSLCGGASGSNFIEDTYDPSATNLAASVVGIHTPAIVSSGEVVMPGAGGGTASMQAQAQVYSGGPTYGAELQISITSSGRIASAALSFFVDSPLVPVSKGAWGCCVREGYAL